jgi:hypothetical protein
MMDESTEEYEYEADYEYPEKSQTFYISRHLNSCNNMVDDAKWTNTAYKFAEPPLSMWGVISGLALNRKILGKFQNKVYVSCLVRTWMTAIIEYFPHVTTNTLDLIISPYIKEADLSNKYYVGQSIDTGNIPETVKVQIDKIKYFFSFLRLMQQYLKKINENRTTDASRINSYNDNILKIQMNLDKILTDGNKINIIFPTFSTIKDRTKIYVDYNIFLTYDNSIGKLVSNFQLKENGKYIKPYDVDPYGYKIKKNEEFTLDLEQEGGNDNNNNENYNYIKSILDAFLEQDLTNVSDEVIDLNDTIFKPLKINKRKKSGYFNKEPNIGIYTTSFGKESMLLFIDWIKNVIQDDSNDIYVVAHSNIMQDTLYSICGKNHNKIIKKRNVDECHEGLYNIVKKQNVWELILNVNDEFITSVKIRKGQEKPNNNSKQFLNYSREKELSCGKYINSLETLISKEYNKHKPVIVQGRPVTIRNRNQQETYEQPKGLFGKMKHFFTKKRRGGKYNLKKYTTKNRKRKQTQKNKKIKK